MSNTATAINTISSRLEEFDYSNADLFKELMIEIRANLRQLELDSIAATNARLSSKEKLKAEDAHLFFRSQERMSNVKLILQYLVTFTEKVPMTTDLEDDIANPFEQFRSFVDYSVELLTAKDVVNAAIQLDKKLGLINDTNIWYYKGKIVQTHKKLKNELIHCRKPEPEDYTKLFNITKELCSFWFSFRNQQMSKIRKTDIYIFQLSTYLIKRLQSL